MIDEEIFSYTEKQRKENIFRSDFWILINNFCLLNWIFELQLFVSNFVRKDYEKNKI